MKRIRGLPDGTSGLKDYLEVETQRPSWDGFHSHLGGRAHRGLIEELMDLQHGLCGYCEIRLTEPEVETARVKRLLMAIEAEFAVIGIDRYRVSEALESLDGRAGVTVDEMAQLERAFIEALDPLNHARHGIPNLERKIAESPVFFVQAVVLPCKRGDGGQDRPEWRAGGADGRSSWRHNAYRLLEQLTRMPGTDVRGGRDRS